MDKYEAELTAVCELLQAAHPMGKHMGIGLLQAAEALKDIIADRDRLVTAAKDVLCHVEDFSMERDGRECTLCFTYRHKLYDAIDAATGGDFRTDHKGGEFVPESEDE